MSTDLSRFKIISFDTYGTLIDWEAGIYQALQPLYQQLPNSAERGEVLQQFAAAESAIQDDDPQALYSEVLERVFTRMALQWDVAGSDTQARAFARSIADWPAFPDSVEALKYLHKHFKLVTMTNCDRASYAYTDALLQHPWDAIYTAEDIGSYKPSQNNFDYLLRQVKETHGCTPDELLHTAQSQYHDIEPAIRNHLATAWIDRRHDQEGFGATAAPTGEYRVDFRFNSLADMVIAHRQHAAR